MCGKMKATVKLVLLMKKTFASFRLKRLLYFSLPIDLQCDRGPSFPRLTQEKPDTSLFKSGLALLMF